MTKKVLEHSFQNEFGQVINPGDPVIIALTCSHQTSTVKGVYHGIIDGPEGNLSVSYEGYGWKDDENGEYKKYPKMIKTHSKMRMVYKFVT